jgi:hypothetical protein
VVGPWGREGFHTLQALTQQGSSILARFNFPQAGTPTKGFSRLKPGGIQDSVR